MYCDPWFRPSEHHTLKKNQSQNKFKPFVLQHPGLLVKLRALGFAGKLLHWLADYLRNRSMNFILNGKSSSTKFINAGVPQGSILGPLLFIIFIDDITLDISSTSILYADDVTLMSFIKFKEERIPAAASLNQDLCNIEKWATSWNVLFGAAECGAVTISNRQDAKDSHPCLQFFGTTLTETKTVELLGLTLSKDLSWKHGVTSMAKSAAQCTGLLRRVAPYLLPTQRAMIYKAIIRSKMEYASSAWFGATPTPLSQLDAVQRRAIRIIDLPEGWPHLSPNSATGNPKRSWSPHIVPPYVLWRGPGTALSAASWNFQLDPRLRRSVRSHDLAVQIRRSNLVSHKRSFVPSAARIWNSLPEYIPSLQKRACFN